MIKLSKVLDMEKFHLRPAAEIVKALSAFESSVVIMIGHQELNAESVIDLLRLGASPGIGLAVRIDGPDEQETMKVIDELDIWMS